MPEESYDVGYGKPPRHSRFKPGRSGNPKGRPKGTRNLKTDLEQELGEKITVTEAGKAKRLTKQHAMVKTMVAKALKGDARTIAILLGLIEKLISPAEPGDAAAPLSQNDTEILDAFVQSHFERLGASKKHTAKINPFLSDQEDTQ